MLDAAVLDDLAMPLPPEPPRIVEERMWLSDLGHQADRFATRLVDRYSTAVADWLGRLSRIQSAGAEVAGPASPAEMQLFDDIIRDWEQLAESRALWRTRLAKRSGRDVARWFKVDPSLGAVTRSTMARLLRLDDQVIEAMLDHALLLRAIRDSVDPKPRDAPVFDDAVTLSRFLRDEVAA